MERCERERDSRSAVNQYKLDVVCESLVDRSQSGVRTRDALVPIAASTTAARRPQARAARYGTRVPRELQFDRESCARAWSFSDHNRRAVSRQQDKSAGGEVNGSLSQPAEVGDAAEPNAVSRDPRANGSGWQRQRRLVWRVDSSKSHGPPTHGLRALETNGRTTSAWRSEVR